MTGLEVGRLTTRPTTLVIEEDRPVNVSRRLKDAIALENRPDTFRTIGPFSRVQINSEPRVRLILEMYVCSRPTEYVDPMSHSYVGPAFLGRS